MDSNAPGVHPQHALAVYAESLAAGARVAVFGDASLGLGAKLAELGARAVHVWDPDGPRARRAAEGAMPGVTVRIYAESDPDVRPFDLAIVADLGLFEDAAAIVRRVRRMVGEEGVAIVAASSAEATRARQPGSRAFDYYDLFDLVAPEFDGVRMIAQLPFHGIALVELGDEDESPPGVNVDTQLGESGRAPEAFVVLASQRGARLEPYTIVQLPSPPPHAEGPEGDRAPVDGLLEAEGRLRAAHADEAARVARAAEADELRRVDELRRAEADDRRRAEADERRRAEADERRQAEAEVGRSRDAASAADREALARAQLRVDLLTSQLDEMRQRLADAGRASETVEALEEALRARSTHAVDLERSLAERGREVAELSTEVEEMRAAAEAGRIAAVQVEALALRADRAERRLATIEQELASNSETQAKELADFEEMLRERSKAMRALEVELARRDRMVRDLVGTLEDLDAPAPPALEPSADALAAARHEAEAAETRHAEAQRALGEENARLRAQLDALALDLARREGEAQATTWHVTELERRLAQASEAPAPPPDGRPDASNAPHPDPSSRSRALDEALDQLDALRVAFAQEHAVRARAESGEELAQARAEIERQAVLMEQLVRELGSRPPPSFDGRGSGGGVGAGEPPSGSSEDSR